MEIDNECTFPFECVGDKTGKKYEGRFTVKVALTNGESGDIAILADRFNGGSLTLPAEHRGFNRAYAELEVRIVRDKKGDQLAPEWWRASDYGRKLLDANVPLKLFQEAVAAATVAWDKSMDEATKAAEASSTPKTKAK